MTLDQQLWPVLNDPTLTDVERNAAIARLIAEHGREPVREAMKHWIDAGVAWARSVTRDTKKKQ
jgi:hypothetical protein